MSGWSSRSHARTTDAKASLISKRSMSSSRKPAFLRARWVAGIGPVSMMVGSTPASAVATTRARAKPERPGPLARHEQQRGGAVGDLRGVGRRDHAVRLERRLERGHLFAIHGHAHALVGVEEGPVRQLAGPDLPLEPPSAVGPPP